MANQTMERTSLASQPPAGRRQAKVAPPIVRLRRPGRPVWLGWARIDLGHEPTDHGVRNAGIAGLSAMTIGMLFGAEALLIETQMPALEPDLPRLLIVDAIAALVLTPLIVWVYLALPDLTTRLLRRLRSDRIIGRAAGGGRLTAFAGDLQHRLNRVPGPTAAMTAIYFAYVLIKDPAELGMTPAELGTAPMTLLIIPVAAAKAALFFLGWTAIIQLCIASQAIGKLLRTFPIHIQLLHPDGCGGLRVVGNLLSLVLSVAAVLGGAGLCIVLALQGTAWAPTHRPEPYVLGGFYLVLLPSAFLHLLWRPHQLMDQRRDQLLKPAARVLNAAILANRPSPADETSRLKDKAEALEELTRQHKLLDEACPRWPLRTRRLRPVIATAVLPVIIPVVTAVISKFLTG
jgi:hypothetical protein